MFVQTKTSIVQLFDNNLIDRRTFNGLKRYFHAYYKNETDPNTVYVADILKLNYDQLMTIRNLGTKSINSLCEMLGHAGFKISGFDAAIAKEQKKRLTPEQFKEKMLKLKERYDKDHDEETFHSDADDLMCDILKKLGYTKGLDIYDSVHKYYS